MPGYRVVKNEINTQRKNKTLNFAENRQTAATVRRILVTVGMFGSNLKHRSRGRYGYRPCTLTSASKPPPPRAAIDGHLLHLRHCRCRPISRSTLPFSEPDCVFPLFFSSSSLFCTLYPIPVYSIIINSQHSIRKHSISGSRRVSAITVYLHS